MLISIASGKGGTGKTTLALLLAAAKPQTSLMDCDVEEPNDHLFLTPNWHSHESVYTKIPGIHPDLCIGCGDCAKACRFNAISVANKKVLLFDELCHSCGGCILACRSKALFETDKLIGSIAHGTATKPAEINIISGKLEVGVVSSAQLIKKMKQQYINNSTDVILDCPPGTSCSMVAAVRNTDYCILVTEPNPFGLHDLEQALNVIEILNIPAGIVINKWEQGEFDKKLEQIAIKYNAPILAKLPHSIPFAEQYAKGIISDEFHNQTLEIWHQITTRRGTAL